MLRCHSIHKDCYMHYLKLYSRQLPACKWRSSSAIAFNITMIPCCMSSNIYVISCIDMGDHDSRSKEVTPGNGVQMNDSQFFSVYHQLSWMVAIAILSHRPGKYINAGLWSNEHPSCCVITVSIISLNDIENQRMLHCNRWGSSGHIGIKSYDCWSSHWLLGSGGKQSL